MHLGTAFQLIDDVLDLSGSVNQIGKNLGDDLSEGKPTLPLLIALNRGDSKQSATIRKAIEQGGLDELECSARCSECDWRPNLCASNWPKKKQNLAVRRLRICQIHLTKPR
jgi:geranylgeranyl pyrophosphate synthase